MKAIENVGVFNRSGYHTRFFLLEFGQPYCYFYEDKSDSSFQRSHKQNEICDCKIMEERDVQSRIE